MASVLHVSAFQDNYIWLIRGPATNAAIVDPGDASVVQTAIENRGLRPAAIFCTHHHRDHTGGAEELSSHYDIPVYGPARENIPGVTHKLQEGDRIAPGGLDLEFDIFDIPGHTAGHIAYYGVEMLFSGDTLFSGGCGRLFEGTAQQMHDSLAKLASLPDNTAVYCGHEYTLSNLNFALQIEPENAVLHRRITEVQQIRRQCFPSLPSTIGIEKQTNPFLRSGDTAVHHAAERHAGKKLDSTVDVFAELRRWKDGFRG